MRYPGFYCRSWHFFSIARVQAKWSIRAPTSHRLKSDPFDAPFALLKARWAAALRKQYRRCLKMHLRLVKTVIVLPGTVLVFIPGAILLATLALSGWAATLFVKLGQGTPAPWDPPKRLVIQGPYCHVRNPMITGALLVLLAETILFQSLPIATWLTVFFIGNAIYFPLIGNIKPMFPAGFRDSGLGKERTRGNEVSEILERRGSYWDTFYLWMDEFVFCPR